MTDLPKAVERAEVALMSYEEEDPVAGFQQYLTDILSDLRHLATDRNLDFAKALRLSELHCQAERGGDEWPCGEAPTL